MSWNINNLKKYSKINMPNDTKFTTEYQKDGVNYNLILEYDVDQTCWYITINYNDKTTMQARLKPRIPLFLSYRYILPHCFFCDTNTGLMPTKANTFENVNNAGSETQLYCCDWDDYINNIINTND